MQTTEKTPNPRRRQLIEELRQLAPDSWRLHQEAIKHFAGGAVGARPPGNPWPIYTTRTDGPYAYDTDDNQYIDCTMAYGTTLLGHNHQHIREAVIAQAHKGLMHLGAGATNLQVSAAEKLKRLLPVNERFVFCNSGTEAIHKCITLARAFTGKDRIVKFSGHYHGTYENMLLNIRPKPYQEIPIAPDPHIAGVSQRAIHETLVLPMNHLPGLTLIEEHADQIAAVFLEPVSGYGLMEFDSDYIRSLAAVCQRNNILLVFDEIITGFRLGPTGSIGMYGVTPDIIAYGKAIAGGMTVGMLATRKDILDPCIKMKPALRMGGTFSGNPMTMAAMDAFLGYIIEHPETLQITNDITTDLVTRINHYIQQQGHPMVVRQVASMFIFHTMPNTPVLMEDLLHTDAPKLDELDIRARINGFIISSMGANVISIAHTPDVINELMERIKKTLDGLYS